MGYFVVNRLCDINQWKTKIHRPCLPGAHDCGNGMQDLCEDLSSSEATVWMSEVLGVGDLNPDALHFFTNLGSGIGLRINVFQTCFQGS